VDASRATSSYACACILALSSIIESVYRVSSFVREAKESDIGVEC
jgi:hypothetical protein